MGGTAEERLVKMEQKIEALESSQAEHEKRISSVEIAAGDVSSLDGMLLLLSTSPP